MPQAGSGSMNGCLDRNLAIRENINVPFSIVSINIYSHTCFNGVHFCPDHCWVLLKAETEFSPCTIVIHPAPDPLLVLE